MKKVNIEKLENVLANVKLSNYTNGYNNLVYEVEKDGMLLFVDYCLQTVFKKILNKNIEYDDEITISLVNEKDGYCYESITIKKEDYELENEIEYLNEFWNDFKIERNYKNDKLNELIKFLYDDEKLDDEEVESIVKDVCGTDENVNWVDMRHIDDIIIDCVENWNE